MNYVFGYTVAHDVSARDWQLEPGKNGGQWLIGKAMDGFCPLGPAIVMKEDINGIILNFLPVVLWGFCWFFCVDGKGVGAQLFLYFLIPSDIASCCRLSLFLQCHIVVFENLVMLDVDKSGYRSTQSWIAMQSEWGNQTGQ